jgi:hypothetical protein
LAAARALPAQPILVGKLHNCVLRSFIVQQLNPNDDTSIYHVFERLNTGGTFLANQEIRNCVYRGNFRELLQELNRLPDWRSIMGKDSIDSRQRDIELILRFFALLDSTKYQKPMKDFLSKLGDRPFHIRRGLNSAVFDCVMVSFAHHLDAVPADIGNRYKQLLEDKTGFLTKVSAGTTDEEVVKDRMRLANERLFG